MTKPLEVEFVRPLTSDDLVDWIGWADAELERRAAAKLPPRPLMRRGLRREDAALYVGMSASKFDQLVREARMPRPTKVDGCVVWDTHKLDAAFEALDEPQNEWDD